jgi:hypothetical protein
MRRYGRICLLICVFAGMFVQTGMGKKIAFLFVAKRDLPFEDIWREFFTWNAHPSEYSIYSHPHPTYHYPRSSFFANTEIKGRVAIQWGTLSLVAANQLLVKEALKDPDNQFFSLFSEACVPVQPFSVWKKLLEYNKSTVRACKRKGERINAERWRKQVEIPVSYWRKTENWFGLTRKHAEIFVNINITKWGEVFAGDEHIIPTTLAYMHLENETTCGHSMTMVSWNLTEDLWHPLWIRDVNITRSFVEALHSPEGYNHDCSGVPNICHFSARKLHPTAAKPLMDHLDILLRDDKQQLLFTTNSTTITGGNDTTSFIPFDNQQYYRMFPTLRYDVHEHIHYALNRTAKIRCPLPSRVLLYYASIHTPQFRHYISSIPALHARYDEARWKVGNFMTGVNLCM